MCGHAATVVAAVLAVFSELSVCCSAAALVGVVELMDKAQSGPEIPRVRRICVPAFALRRPLQRTARQIVPMHAMHRSHRVRSSSRAGLTSDDDGQLFSMHFINTAHLCRSSSISQSQSSSGMRIVRCGAHAMAYILLSTACGRSCVMRVAYTLTHGHT